MKKIDIHLHLTYQQFPKTNKIYMSSAKNMLPHLEKLGIEFGILQSGGEEKALFSSNQECYQICKTFPENYAFMCNLDEEKIETIGERLEKYKEMGAVGIGELMINKRLDNPFLQEVFRCAEKLELPVLIHMSPEEGFQYGVVDEPGLPLLEEVLRKYPDLKIIGHSQPFWHEITKDAQREKEKRMEWGKGAVKAGGRLIELFENYPNLYGDLSANSGGYAMMRDARFGLSFLEKFQDRLFFGTDMVHTEMEYPLGKWLDSQYKKENLSKEAYKAICFRNAERIFNLKIEIKEGVTNEN